MNLKTKRYLEVNLLGQDPRLMKRNSPGRGLTKFEKHCSKANGDTRFLHNAQCHDT